MKGTSLQLARAKIARLLIQYATQRISQTMLCPVATAKIREWCRAYDRLQVAAIVLLYFQVGCALIGSLGASYTGLLLANLVIALFALVAIESGSQTLGRTYAVLLFCALLLDIVWFILFSVEIRQISLPVDGGKFTAFSLQLVLWMQIAGFIVRFLSAFLWLQMYRLGLNSGSAGVYQPLELEGGLSTFGYPSPVSSPHVTALQSSLSDEVLGGSIYNPAYYSSLFSPLDQSYSLKENNGRQFDANLIADQSRTLFYNSDANEGTKLGLEQESQH